MNGLRSLWECLISEQHFLISFCRNMRFLVNDHLCEVEYDTVESIECNTHFLLSMKCPWFDSSISNCTLAQVCFDTWVLLIRLLSVIMSLTHLVRLDWMRGFFCYCFSNLAFSVLFFFVSWNNSTLAVFYHVTTLTLFISIVVLIFLVVVGIRATQRADSPQVSGMILSAFSSFCYFLPSFSLVQLLLLLSFK